MAYKFSPTTKGFYIDGLHTIMPSDVVAITDIEYSEVFAQLCDGKVIGVNPNTGKPIAVQGIGFVPTWDFIRSKRDTLLDNTDWTQVSDNKLTDEERLAWKVYRQQLRDITNVATVSDVVWPAEPPSAS